jgi:hypothetical protein
MFKASPDEAMAMRSSLSTAEREMWAKHFSDVADRTTSEAGKLLNQARADFLRGKTDVPPGNIKKYQ